jgi:hypothetical protein
MNIQAKVAIDKQKHPERFCPAPRCLWKTAKLNHKTQIHEGGGYCPRHRAALRAGVGVGPSLYSESAAVIVNRLRSHRIVEEETSCPKN